jgi:photosystem II stability/assembly factor-like uncharacterized protein
MEISFRKNDLIQSMTQIGRNRTRIANNLSKFSSAMPRNPAFRAATFAAIFLLLGSTFLLFVPYGSGSFPARSSGSSASISKDVNQQVNVLENAHPASSAPLSRSTTHSALSSMIVDPPSSWVSLGPEPIATNSSFTWGEPPFSGRITAIAVNGSNPQEIFVGAAQGGVWKSADGGTTWTPLTDSEQSLAVGSITLSPDNKTIYVGTGEGNECGDCYYGIGLLKSTDGGATWTILGQSYFSGLAITSILINPLRPNQMLVSTQLAVCCGAGVSLASASSTPGIFLTTDGGSTWSEIHTGGVAQLTLVPQSTSSGSGNVPFAGNFSGGVWALETQNFTLSKPEMDWSTTGNWIQFFSEMDPNCESSFLCRVAVASTAAQSNSVYVALVNSTGALAAIDKCDIVASPCTAVTNPQNVVDNFGGIVPPCGANGQGWYDLVLSVDPTNANNLYFGCTSLYRSMDGGTTWTPLGGYSAGSIIHPDMHALAFTPGNPSTIFVGNDGGIWKSTDQGTSWMDLNQGLSITQFYYMAVSNSGKLILAGSQDNGCNEYDGSVSWNQVETGDGGWVGFDPANSQILYCVVDGIPLTSMDGGITFQLANKGILFPGSLDAPMAQDLRNPGTLYFGAGGVIYKTTNNMQNWSLMTNDTSGSIISLAVSPSNSSIVYGGDSAGNVLVSKDNGTSWTTLGTVSNPVQSIAVNPMNASDVYVAASLFGSPVVMEFLNGVERVLSTSGLPSSSVNVIKIFQGKIFAGLDSGGVYYLELGGSSWTQVGSAFPNSAVFDLAESNGTLYAATHGRGVLSISTPLVNPIRLTLSYQVIGGEPGYIAPTVTFVSQGVLKTATINASSGTVYADYGTAWSVNGELTGSTSSERWETNQMVSSSATSNVTLVISYYHQYLQTLSYSVAGGGSATAPSAMGEQFGSAYSQPLTTSATGYWFDAGSSITLTNPVAGAPGERWQSATSSVSVTPGQTVSVSYYHQFYFAVGPNSSGGGSVTGTSGWYNSSTSLSMSASAASGWQFEDWNGIGASSYSGSSSTQSVTLNSPVNETAVFYASLVLSAGPQGSISYSYGSTSGTIPAGTSKTIYVPPGTNVVVSETPSSFLYAFNGWSGALTGTTGQRSVSINSPSEISASFGINTLAIVLIVAAVIAVAGGIVAVIRRRKVAP